jgi:hypothetical protein
MELRVGTVESNADVMQEGYFYASFKEGIEPVRYVTPYGGEHAAFIAIPQPGNTVLIGRNLDTYTGEDTGNFYLGSLFGNAPGKNQADIHINQTPEQGDYQPQISGDPGHTDGPPNPKGANIYPKEESNIPDGFKDMYQGKGIIPEIVGLMSHKGSGVTIHDRYRGGDSPEQDPFQDYTAQIQSGQGKSVSVIDSAEVNGIVIKNEHSPRDYIILSSGSKGAFAEGELFIRTHGPINQYTEGGYMKLWVEEGTNLDIINKATGQDSTILPDDPLRTMQPMTVDDADNVKDRIYEFADETWGCIKLVSELNNIAVSALAEDAVIHLHTSGANSKVIVHSAGTVDIVAEKKITLQSKSEIEINAPVVDINGKDFVYVDGGEVHLNKPHTPAPDWEF